MSQSPASRPSPINPQGGPNTVVRLGQAAAPLNDLYHYLLRAPWRHVLGLILLVYMATNAVFACLYAMGGACIENAEPGSWVDGFFFSVQTLATIGYGKMAPITRYAHVLVTMEALGGVLGIALMTGIIFAKFSRPTARVLFSNVATVVERDGVPSLIFRMANERSNAIVEAHVRVIVARNEVTLEGERVRRFYDLELARDTSITFVLTWTVIHPITAASPLFGATPASLAAQGAEIIVSITGMDGTTVQTIYARHGYTPDALRWGERLVDILGRTQDGRTSVDYTRFHDTQPQAARAAA